MEFTQDQKVYAEIVQKAWEDIEFKKELLANPMAAIEKLTGKKLNLPEGKTLVVRDQTDDATIYINIPSKVELDAELNEEQLEAVAGGAIWPPTGTGLPPWIIPTLPLDN
jgi:hypothetical protein